jgi:hypothetical protein
MPDGTIVVSRAPHYRKSRATKKQKEHRARFKEATEYGKWAGKVYPIYGELAKGTKGSAYSFALSNWWHAPVIHRIERQDGCTLVEATDNVMVTKVIQ